MLEFAFPDCRALRSSALRPKQFSEFAGTFILGSKIGALFFGDEFESFQPPEGGFITDTKVEGQMNDIVKLHRNWTRCFAALCPHCGPSFIVDLLKERKVPAFAGTRKKLSHSLLR